MGSHKESPVPDRTGQDVTVTTEVVRGEYPDSQPSGGDDGDGYNTYDCGGGDRGLLVVRIVG